jgi:hypothetical protein
MIKEESRLPPVASSLCEPRLFDVALRIVIAVFLLFTCHLTGPSQSGIDSHSGKDIPLEEKPPRQYGKADEYGFHFAVSSLVPFSVDAGTLDSEDFFDDLTRNGVGISIFVCLYDRHFR